MSWTVRLDKSKNDTNEAKSITDEKSKNRWKSKNE